MLLPASVVMVPREEENNLNTLWTQEEDVEGLVWLQKQGAYVSRDVVLLESLPQCLREPLGHTELQGFTGLPSPLRQKENWDKTEERSQGKAADVLMKEPSSPPPSRHLSQVLSEAS